MSFWYEQETGQLRREPQHDGGRAPYIRGGYLTRIDYGTRATTSLQHATAADRLRPGRSLPRGLRDPHGVHWPDTPWDQDCTARHATRSVRRSGRPSGCPPLRPAPPTRSAVSTSTSSAGRSTTLPGPAATAPVPASGSPRSATAASSVPRSPCPTSVHRCAAQQPCRRSSDGSPAMNWWRVTGIVSRVGSTSLGGRTPPATACPAAGCRPRRTATRCAATRCTGHRGRGEPAA